MFVWRVYLNSLPTKMTLKGRRVLSREEDIACVLCGTELETADHLLMHCKWSWGLWVVCLRWWGISWVLPRQVKSLLESLMIEGTSKSYKRVWRTLIYAILWSIWEERNKRCFQKKKRSIEEIWELVKARLTWWAKYRSSKCPYPVSTISRCIEEERDSF
ncbi:hypothetical protein QQ045_019052 [Rhodiola kirilowii]